MAIKKKLFVFIDWYAPAYKAGGPIMATVNFVEAMKHSYRLFIFTGNRDLGETAVLPGVESDTWINKEEDLSIFYASEAATGFAAIKRQLQQVAPDFIYINSIYSVKFAFLPLLISRFYQLPAKVFVSPRGMLKDSAVNHKRTKKIIYLKLFRLLQLQRKVVFLASDTTEQKDTALYFGKDTASVIVPDMVAYENIHHPAAGKNAGELRIVFIGRIHPIKNLLFLLQCLAAVKTGKVLLTITGNLEDAGYWAACEQKIKILPAHITVEMKNGLPHRQIRALLLEHHLFMLPTKGENFGHAIFEALNLGKPVLISDQTPWRNLSAAGAGWDLPLDSQDAFVEALQEALAWNQATYNMHSEQAWLLTKKFIENNDILSNYKSIFS